MDGLGLGARRFSLIVLVALIFQLFSPLLPAVSPPAALAAPDDTNSALQLFRARIRVAGSAEWKRLDKLGVKVLDGDERWAMVLADSDQLTRLAQLGFQPEQADEVE